VVLVSVDVLGGVYAFCEGFLVLLGDVIDHLELVVDALDV